MKMQEIILGESSTTASIQNKDVIQIETAINVNDDISNDTTNDPIYKLYQQGFEELSKQMEQINLHLKNHFEKNLNKIETESINSNNYTVDVEGIRKKFEEMFDSQSEEIESLNARIEELESDNNIKDQDLEKFKQEFDNFKKESRSSLKTKPTQNKDTLIMNDNEHTTQNKDTLIMNENEHTTQNNDTLIVNENEHNENIGEELIEISTSQQSNKSESKTKKSNKNKKVHKKIRKFVNQHKNKPKKSKDNTLKFLIDNFTIQDLLEFEKSLLFHRLDDNIKNSVKLSISRMLKEELIHKKMTLSQPIDVYIKRDLIPSLPSGVKSYNEFQKTKEFDLFSKEVQIGIRKLILIE